MYPELAQFGPVTIHSFGVMMALAFAVAGLVTAWGLRQRGVDPELTYSLLIAAVVGGIVGSKVHYLLLHPDEVTLGGVFSGSGLVWYGGLIGGTLAVSLVAYFSPVRTAVIADAIAPALAAAYAVGRVGCLLRGDDYGKPTDLPWGMSFPEGLPPTTEQVHPTQIYETLGSLAIFALLVWVIAPRLHGVGSLFWSYMVLAGIERFLVEFLRTNTPGALGLTHAQWISVFLMVGGAIGVWWVESRADRRQAAPGRRPLAAGAAASAAGRGGSQRNGTQGTGTAPGKSSGTRKKARRPRGRR
jgi:phosphatidylglycerol:prolipoprotein diacylglycerol transferase